jgi:hypothetical protein
MGGAVLLSLQGFWRILKYMEVLGYPAEKLAYIEELHFVFMFVYDPPLSGRERSYTSRWTF